jgi:outer membrane protein assembly factor BamB
LWSRDLGVINVSKYGIGWGFGSSPVLFRDRIVLQCDSPDDPYVVVLSVADGKELWRAARKNLCERSWATPFVYDDGGRVQIVTNGWPFVVSYDLLTGRELWRLRGGGDNPIPTPFAAHGLIYVANGHGGQTPLFAVRPTAAGDISLKPDESSNAHVAWSAPRNNAYIQTPLVYGDLLYSGTNNGVLKCYEAKTGAKQYEHRLGEGKIYFTSEDGDVFVVRAGPRFELLAHNRMGQSCLATPAISRGSLFFRTRHQVVAIGPGS